MAFSISSGIVQTPNRCALYGVEGIGKTTLGSQAPRAVFIDLEGGSLQLPVSRIDPPNGRWSWVDLLRTLKEVAQDTSQIGTLVIDSVDEAERLCVERICERDGKENIEDWGYGKGYKVITTEFEKLFPFLDAVVASGANVILIGHCVRTKFERPDEMGSFDRYEINLINTPKASNAAAVKRWCDTLLFCDYKNEVTVSAKTNKAKVTGFKRLIHTQHSGAWDAKNRFGLPPEIPMDFAPLLPYFPDHGQVSAPAPAAAAPPTPVPQPQPAPVQEPVEEAVPADAYEAPPAVYSVPAPEPAPEQLPPDGLGQAIENVAAVFPGTQVAIEPPQPQAGGAWTPGQPYDPLHPTEEQVSGAEPYELFGYPASHAALANVMAVDGITDEVLRRFMAANAFQPLDLPVSEYTQACVDWLCASWEQIVPQLKNLRNEE